MDAESADMLAALRRQIQPHLMLAALTPPHLSSGHPAASPAQLNYSLPLSTYMMSHVSTPSTYSIDLVSRLAQTAPSTNTTNTSHQAVNFTQHVKNEARDRSTSRRPSDEEPDDGDEENISDLPLNLVATSLSEEAHWKPRASIVRDSSHEKQTKRVKYNIDQRDTKVRSIRRTKLKFSLKETLRKNLRWRDMRFYIQSIEGQCRNEN